MEKFLQEEHTFLEYEKQVLKYNEIISELQYDIPRVCICDLSAQYSPPPQLKFLSI